MMPLNTLQKLFQLMAKLSLLSLLLVNIAFAESLELAEAKQLGVVGEMYNGYIGPVRESAGKDVQDLVNHINTLRRMHYKRIAKLNSSPLSSVERIGGQSAIKKTPTGQYIRLEGEGWKKK